jgi:hypothetical protein
LIPAGKFGATLAAALSLLAGPAAAQMMQGEKTMGEFLRGFCVEL